MQALLSVAPGGPETLELTTLPDPEPGKGELLIGVKAAGVNYPDTLMIRDLYQIKPPRPFAPGGEIAGEILAIGEDVAGFEVGDRVLALTGHGGFATHMTIKASTAVKFPQSMPFEDAACFIFTYGTSYHALKDRAHLRADETVLVLGAAGGVGTAAIELSKAQGARVIAAVSSQEKAEFCRKIGADEVIVYDQQMDRDAQKAFSGEIKAMAGPLGVDVVYDAVGGDYAEPALRSMAWNGRYLVVGFPAGIPNIPLNLPLLKGCQIVGVFWGASVFRDPAGHTQNINDLFSLYGEGKIKPQISATFPLDQAQDALVKLADRSVLGKVVVSMP
ncbi:MULTISPECIES: NADPH:quinone oxidoreductase family protein [unclassified Ruegeria]|uniref:NADPH:quinone oxidoreductase family protein n=1 Tax=unclassified Ruegeria TaxID=2625375 RepID=UPI001ADCDBF1|nr:MULTISPECIES: NADPH:quinone oxidoreductase family protein [unclassified Ruegeria]MBO9413378.1 NADPH:quinone oxidoreductase family protein [Ruegeria sp. R8_1]MBO9414042.1 NADPH:quinone oxidoreductase family protein [Ruegeria sp. R8_2]